MGIIGFHIFISLVLAVYNIFFWSLYKGKVIDLKFEFFKVGIQMLVLLEKVSMGFDRNVQKLHPYLQKNEVPHFASA